MKNDPKIGGPGKSADPHVRNSGRVKSGRGLLSKALLHDLRNKIPVRALIENELGVRCETESGIFRFECPVCGSFHTSVLENKNIARCFGCETNFNTIDIAMEVGKTGFRQSADFLTDLLESGAFEKPNARAARGPSEPVSLSRVLSSLAPADGTAERIQSLEKKVEKLGKRMDGLQKFLLDNLSERGA